MKFRQANEGFDWVLKGKDKAEQIDRLKQWAKTNQTVVPMVRMGIGAELVEWNLPEGVPETMKVDKDLPEGMGDTTIQMEWRRISAFIDPKNNMQNLPEWKREMNWLQILEGMHWKEMEVLTAIKDVELLKVYPKLEKLLPDLGITDWKGKRKPRKKKEVTQ